MLDLSGIPLADILPSWAMHPDVERAEWVNTIISRLWPTITGYFKKIVKDKIYHKVVRFRLKTSSFPFINVLLFLMKRAERFVFLVYK